MGQDKGKSLFRGVSYLHVGRGQRMGKFYINRRSKSCGHSDANFTSLKRGGLYKKWIYKLNFADSHGARRSKPGRWEKDSYKSQYINSLRDILPLSRFPLRFPSILNVTRSYRRFAIVIANVISTNYQIDPQEHLILQVWAALRT